MANIDDLNIAKFIVILIPCYNFSLNSYMVFLLVISLLNDFPSCDFPSNVFPSGAHVFLPKY